MDRPSQITMKGNPLTLTGNQVKVGDKAPDFTVLDTDMKPVGLQNSKGKVRLISVAPSLDTPTCDTQTVTFNKKAAELGDDVALYSMSMDLPFAQKRYCAQKSVDQLQTLSDYKDASFGENYGLLIEELRLLGRAVVVVDKDDKISYMQIVPEVTEEPDYDSALNAVKEALGK
ncbi:thiol peroxidase [candidate division GN15 bacterium]|nr:thiol peroxidase [candidate division GN15 bacterium]